MNMDGKKMDIKKHIKELMDERGWTPYRLSKESSLSHSTISNIFKRNNAPCLPHFAILWPPFGNILFYFSRFIL